jgi:restriction system protein
MPIPDYQSLMLPLLIALSDGEDHTVREARERVAQQLKLSEEQLRETIPSGKKLLFADRLSWATTYLKQAAVIASPKRGVYRITARGTELLVAKPKRIDNDLLSQFPEFTAFLDRSTESDHVDGADKTEHGTPEESLDAAYQRLRGAIEAELLQQVLTASPAFFERLVVELLVKMGYGGSLEAAGRAIGKSGDGGIDGIINEDRLGLDVIHIQAKRWSGKTVSRPDVQSFAGSLDGVRAKKGIFITTSNFSSEAQSYVQRIDKRIVLIDGVRLVQLMFDFGVGAVPVATYEIKRVDSDYFSEE